MCGVGTPARELFSFVDTLVELHWTQIFQQNTI